MAGAGFSRTRPRNPPAPIYLNRTVRGSFRAAQHYLNARLAECEQGRELVGGSITLNQYLDRWLESRCPAEAQNEVNRGLYLSARSLYPAGSRQTNASRPRATRFPICVSSDATKKALAAHGCLHPCRSPRCPRAGRALAPTRPQSRLRRRDPQARPSRDERIVTGRGTTISLACPPHKVWSSFCSCPDHRPPAERVTAIVPAKRALTESRRPKSPTSRGGVFRGGSKPRISSYRWLRKTGQANRKGCESRAEVEGSLRAR